jgi:hypothetical protein
MQSIEKSAFLLFNSIVEMNEEQMTNSLIILMNCLENRMSKSDLSLNTNILRMNRIFMQLNPLLTSPFQTRIVEKGVERMFETTFKDIFLTDISSQNWHNCVVKSIAYKCDFHEESLFTHCILAMISSVWYLLATEESVSNEYATFIAAIALLHDIGKPAVMQTGIITIGDSTKRITKFPAHALIGGIILQKAYTPSFGFGIEMWDTLCRCVSVHMCGYHCTDETNPITQSKWLRLSLETEDVKKALLYLSVGDGIGNIRTDELKYDEQLFASRKKFIQSLETTITEPSKIFTKLGTNGLIIVIAGSSGAGKSTLASQLTAYFTVHEIGTTYVSRDSIMLEMVCPILGLEVSQSAYSQCYEYTKANNLGKEIDEQVKQRISNAVAFGEVCIIDTVACFYRKVFNSYFSDDMLNCEILQIVVDRNVPHTQQDADRLGLMLQQQISLSGECSLINPLSKLDHSNISGLASSMESWNIKRDFSNRSQCTLTASIVWNNSYTFGLTYVYNLLSRLMPGLKKGINIPVNTTNMDVIEYVNYIYGLCDSTDYRAKYDALNRRFAVQHFVVNNPSFLRGTEFEGRIFSIKYRDGINRMWRPTWARQCRGVCFYVQDNFTCIPIKYQLQRGAELMTGMLVSAQIASTQDISDAKKIACLSNSQQRTCKTLLAGENDGLLNAHLTEKVDGSLLTITFYFGEQAILMTKIISKFGDDFSKMILRGFSELGFVGVVSTQGTLIIGEDMQDYFVTSIAESKLGNSRNELVEMIGGCSPTEFFDKYCKFWFKEMASILTKLPTVEGSDNISLCWETVCAGRYTLWNKLHQELAISYTNSMYLFLGASWCSKFWVINVPHTMLNIDGISEPRYWITETAKQVDDLMRGLEDVVYGRLNSIEFLTKFVPSNKTFDITLPLHPEGYVCYTKEGEILGLPLVDYNKLKLSAYYIGHKFHDNSIKELYLLSKTASHIFPMAKAVGDYYGSLDKFLEIAKKLNARLGDFGNLLEGKAAKSYPSATKEVQCKMIINAAIPAFDSWLKNLVCEYFPTIATTDIPSDSVKSGLRRMVMDLKPWLNYVLETPSEFSDILLEPINYSGLASVFLMLMHQTI